MERKEAGNFTKVFKVIEDALRALRAGEDWFTVSRKGAQASQEFINAKGAKGVRSGGDDFAGMCPYKLEPRRDQ